MVVVDVWHSALVWVYTAVWWIWTRHLRRRQSWNFQVHRWRQQESRAVDQVVEVAWCAVTVRLVSTTVCRAVTAAGDSSSVPCAVTCSTSARRTAGVSSTLLDATNARHAASTSVCVSTWTRTVSDHCIVAIIIVNATLPSVRLIAHYNV